MANVYLAVLLAKNGFSKLAVLKVPRAHVSEDADLFTMFLDEARLAARLNHPNIVQTYEVAEGAGRDVIVMEYLEGHSLSEILSNAKRTGRPLPLGLHLRIVIEALHGLHYAHEATDYGGQLLGLVHRDVSPQNIFVTYSGQVKLLDFGIAKASTSSHTTQAGTIKGKVRYMPPEQFSGIGINGFAGGRIDRRADIFAVGVILWEAATGQRMWKGVPDAEIIGSILQGSIPAPHERNPDVDAALDAIVRKALAFDREDRYASCLELEEALESFMESRSIRSTTKDLGALVSDAFADMRQERSRVIDEQVRRATVESSGEYRVLARGELPGAGPHSESLMMPGRPLGAAGSPLGDPTRASEVGEAGRPRHARRSGRILVVLGATALVVLALGGLQALRTGADAGPVPGAPAAALAANLETPGHAGPVVMEKVSVTFAAWPREAILFVDGERLPSNPAQRSVPRDGSHHMVRVEAKGYLTRTVEVVYDGEKDVPVALDRSASAPARTPRSAGQAPPPRRAAAPPAPSPAAIESPAAPVSVPSPATLADPRPRRPDVHIDEKL